MKTKKGKREKPNDSAAVAWTQPRVEQSATDLLQENRSVVLMVRFQKRTDEAKAEAIAEWTFSREQLYNLAAPLAAAAVPEEPCESDLIEAAKTTECPSHLRQSTFEGCEATRRQARQCWPRRVTGRLC
ncbi:unnamed protein product [Lota lota]